MIKIKYISLDLTPECRSEIMDCIPPLHCFQNSCHTNNASEVLLKGVVLLRDAHINDEDMKDLATDLANKYEEYEGKSFKITLTHIGWDDCVMAFKCANDLVGIEPDRQILVISTYNYHNPKEAKSISKWIELKPIELQGILTFH